MRKAIHREDGTAAIEFAILAFPFFLFFVALFEISVMMFGERILQEALVDAARAVRTGQARSNVTVEAFKKNYLCPRLVMLRCENVIVQAKPFKNFASVNLQPPKFTNPNKPPKPVFVIGNSSDVMIVRAFYPWKLISPMMGTFFSNIGDGKTRILVSGVVFRNEPY